MSLFKKITGHERNEIVTIKKLLKLIWAGRKSCMICGMVGMVVGILISLSIPKEYTVKVLLTPESYNSSDGLYGKVALGLTSSVNGSEDAYKRSIYSQIINSTQFLHDLLYLPFKIGEKNGDVRTLHNILEKENEPWWKFGSLWNSFYNETNDFSYKKKLETVNRYTPDEYNSIDKLRRKIVYVTIESTGGIELEVRMQDPKVAAQLADTVLNRFEKYIQDYRIKKAENKLEYSKRQENEAREEYYILQDSLAKYKDCHQSIATAMEGINLQRLQSETELAYQAYQAAVLDRQISEINITETKPIFTAVIPPVVPDSADFPKKMVIISYCIFFAVFIRAVKSILKPA